MDNVKLKILAAVAILFSLVGTFMMTVAVALLVWVACSGLGGNEERKTDTVESVVEVKESESADKPNKSAGKSRKFVGKPNKIVYLNLKREFNDLNDTQLAAAQQIGIKPLASRKDIPKASRKLHLVCANMGFWGPEPYVVDRLTHSTPYLVKDAADLLHEIGVNFQDSLRSKHISAHSIVVTSVLRTDADVKSLSKSNVNASQRSVHCYGTTFDISYKRFVKHDENARNAREADLVAVLGEVLRDLKKNGRCYVKHEVKQACFHITARKR